MGRLKFEYGITLGYLLLGGLWIIFSDKLLLHFVHRADVLSQLQTYKGWFYVLITAILLYFLLKSHLKKLRNAEMKAKESDHLKSVFIQNISHEIRTPMNGILGFTGLLYDQTMNQHQRAYLEKIRLSTDRLLTVVNEILDISMIETGMVTIYESRINLNEFLQEIHSSFQPFVKEDINLTLKKGLSDNSSMITTDEIKLRQILNNLIENALKFTEKGFVEFGYTIREKQIEFFVRDSGIGIPVSLHAKIFEPFHKFEYSKKKLFDGVGLGLSISKGIVSVMKGKIRVESEENKGSSFYFTIPYNAGINTNM
jgi:signal transduction histidine kinase